MLTSLILIIIKGTELINRRMNSKKIRVKNKFVNSIIIIYNIFTILAGSIEAVALSSATIKVMNEKRTNQQQRFHKKYQKTKNDNRIKLSLLFLFLPGS